MQESVGGGAKQGPALQDSVQEVQGRFPSDAALQDALGRLTLAGFDRAEFSLPEEQSAATPNESAQAPTDSIDKTQLRTMGSSMAGFAGASAVAGATIATGGAAGVAALAAAVIGAGTLAAGSAVGKVAEEASSAERDRRGAAGMLVLAVRTHSAEQAEQVMQMMREAGAQSVAPVTRTDDALTRGVSSAAWTGG
ncbi:MAG: hypothetical protein NVSMB18_31720 [Acetobacteraceae bacterium]